jgi:hypothetical protein
MPTNAAPHAPISWKPFAWQGVRLTVPTDWELAYTHGRRADGFLRLTDVDGVRMELRWNGRRTKSPAADGVDACLADVCRAARKSGKDFGIRRDTKLASPPGMQAECYAWTERRQNLGMLSRCTGCGRTVHLHVMGRPGEPLKGTARRIFASLQDHPDAPDAPEPWRFHDMAFAVPPGQPLLRQRLRAGLERMVFGRRRTRIEFLRASLAELLLTDADLKTCFVRMCARSLRRRSFKATPQKHRGHDAIRVEGRPWLIVNPLRLVGLARTTQAVCWHCDTTNRIMACCYDGPASGADTWRLALDSFTCCDDDGGSRQSGGTATTRQQTATA